KLVDPPIPTGPRSGAGTHDLLRVLRFVQHAERQVVCGFYFEEKFAFPRSCAMDPIKESAAHPKEGKLARWAKDVFIVMEKIVGIECVHHMQAYRVTKFPYQRENSQAIFKRITFRINRRRKAPDGALGTSDHQSFETLGVDFNQIAAGKCE